MTNNEITKITRTVSNIRTLMIAVFVTSPSFSNRRIAGSRQPGGSKRNSLLIRMFIPSRHVVVDHRDQSFSRYLPRRTLYDEEINLCSRAHMFQSLMLRFSAYLADSVLRPNTLRLTKELLIRSYHAKKSGFKPPH